eukprot:6482131-Amphidinium_carterae.3
MASRRLFARCFQWFCIDALLALCIACIFDDASSSVLNWVPSATVALVDPFAENLQLYVDHAARSRPSAIPSVNAISKHNCTVLANSMSIDPAPGSLATSPWVSGVAALSPQFWMLDTFITVEGEGMAIKFAPVDDFYSPCQNSQTMTTEIDYKSLLLTTTGYLQHSLADACHGLDLSSHQVVEHCHCESRPQLKDSSPEYPDTALYMAVGTAIASVVEACPCTQPLSSTDLLTPFEVHFLVGMFELMSGLHHMLTMCMLLFAADPTIEIGLIGQASPRFRPLRYKRGRISAPLFNPRFKDDCFFECLAYQSLGRSPSKAEVLRCRALVADVWLRLPTQLAATATSERMSPEEYLQAIKGRMWGGQPEVRAIELALGLKVQIIRGTATPALPDDNICYIPPFYEGGPPNSPHSGKGTLTWKPCTQLPPRNRL